MAEDGKRKDAPAAAAGQQRSKKKKTGNAGKWMTPHQQAKAVLQKDAGLQPGDTGIWVTCARHQEGKAAREVEVLFAEYAEKMYGIKTIHDSAPRTTSSVADGDDVEEQDEEEDIEAAIQREIAALTSKPNTTTNNATEGADNNGNRMIPVKMNVDCLLFVKTRPPVDPVAFVRRICEDARRCEEILGIMRCRYVNRLTPVSVMGKATEAGVAEVAREVLSGCFDLNGKRSGDADAGQEEGGAKGEVSTTEEIDSRRDGEDPGRKPFTFAIRPTIRNHSNLKRDVVINTIAGLINDDRHKVNLTAPDKVILVDIYQTVCGMSVVDGDWDELKRFNLTELYNQGRNAQKPPGSKGQCQ
ncbi:hypothetical protein N657DRAFT_380106 [Parathielavia appendiculata]|uniref:THUMP domain-containing protein n=1 Tax=Parathielavia appendiculata TaxID=2587402 RepID=A0AAN6Z4T5_9PEZI|nr:hypothetical protein N657DRAFT_380106 [Parathielavia appendiculata]